MSMNFSSPWSAPKPASVTTTSLSARAARVAASELQPWAILAKGPPCMSTGVCSRVCTRLGAMASRSRTVMGPTAPRSAAVAGVSSSRQATTMRPSRRSRSARSSARQRIAITSEAAVISKRASRSVPRGDWPPSSPRPMRTRRRLRSLRSSTRGQVTRAGSMPSALPQWRWLSSSAASRLWAAVTAWRSPLKWRLMASMGTTWAWPPPAAPPFMPKTGPSEGSRRQAMADTPSRERASTSPTQVVVLPSPTPAGEGKTTTCVGLVDALSRLGVSAMACLREPSLGPVFGMKGGAAGGGHAQVVPMEAINLHFNGDLHAVTAAHNLLAALLDNHLHWGNALGIDPARVTWPRVLDLNDRSLRRVRIGLGEEGGQSPRGTEREARFEITAASEVMAILCLAEDLADLERRLGRIVVAWREDDTPATAADLGAVGPMTVLLRDAMAPNLVQT